MASISIAEDGTILIKHSVFFRHKLRIYSRGTPRNVPRPSLKRAIVDCAGPGSRIVRNYARTLAVLWTLIETAGERATDAKSRLDAENSAEWTCLMCEVESLKRSERALRAYRARCSLITYLTNACRDLHLAVMDHLGLELVWTCDELYLPNWATCDEFNKICV